MSRVTSHHFNNLHPAMRAGGRAGSFDYFGYIAEGGVEPQSIVSARDVLVDCFGDSDHSDAKLRESRGDTEGVLSAASHDCIKPELLNVFNYFTGAILKAAIFH